MAQDSPKPPVFSREQLDWIAAQTLRAAQGAARRTRNQAVVGFVILAVGLGVVAHTSANDSNDSRENIVKSGDAVAVDGCNRDFTTIDNLRTELVRSLDRIDQLEADGTYTHAQAQAGRESTRQFLDRYSLPDCRLAERILTDDPTASVDVPTPRYPNDPIQQAEHLSLQPQTQDLRNP